MENSDYLCPFCRSQLKANNKIILASRKTDGSRGLILFNPKLGNYDILHHENYPLYEGEHLDILCPLCHANLTEQAIDKNLARILMIDATGAESKIYFSEIVGMQCTYKIVGDNVEAFGEDSDEFRNYWGVSPGY